MSPTALRFLVFAACGSLGIPSGVMRSNSRLLVLREAQGYPPARTPRSALEPSEPQLKIYEMNVESRVEYRFATTLISTRVANAANVSQEASFSVDIPDNAFISSFKMQVEERVYEAYVKEKEAAKREYSEAVARGQGAGHVSQSARDTNQFTISVNVEPQNKVTFNLTYDELLNRRMGAYNLAINLDPKQPVRKMTVGVHIKESRNITVLRVPELRSGNEVDADENTTANNLATIERISPTEAHITFTPSLEQQKSLGHVGQPDSKKSLKGQFVVQYDVDRETQTGEILVNNGYFVHFYAPKHLQPLQKHAIFVLDVSGSMLGRKMAQLKEAMLTILDELNEGDYFNIIEFSHHVKVWNLDAMAESAVIAGPHCISDECHNHSAPTPAFTATSLNIAHAKTRVEEMYATGSTNIHAALKTAISVAHNGLRSVASTEKHTPVIVFLTDGQPTTTSTTQILNTVNFDNRNPTAALFSLAFGNDADVSFLRKLSLKNAGFARKIYEASDAALQLRDFYRQIASPLLANVTFSYQPDQVLKNTTTKTTFPTFYSGSEIVVAGQLTNELTEDELTFFNGGIFGESKSGTTEVMISIRPYNIRPNNTSVTSLEKLWAYLTIKQLLEQQEAQNVEDHNTTNLKQRALELALRYSFVTSLTSLVVVKPNASEVSNSGTHEMAPGVLYRQRGFNSGSGSATGLVPSSRMYLGRRKNAQHSKGLFPSRQPGGVQHGVPGLTLIPVQDLEWLDKVRVGGDVILPFGMNGTNQTYTLDHLVAQPETTSAVCTTPSGSQGHCQHLKICSLNVFKNNIDAYKPFFCLVNSSFAGVCCPGELLSTPTTPSA